MELLKEESYEVNEKTLAIAIHYDAEYRTKVFELDSEPIYVKTRALQLIDDACITGVSSYEGRVTAVRKLTGFQKKVPIPVLPNLGVYAFPTVSPNRFDCYWIFVKYLEKAEQLEISGKKDKRKTKLHFCDKQTIDVDISYYRMQEQITKTSYCKMVCEQRGYYKSS